MTQGDSQKDQEMELVTIPKREFDRLVNALESMIDLALAYEPSAIFYKKDIEEANIVLAKAKQVE